MPGRQRWNPAATGAGRIDGVAKVTGSKLYASDFRAADMPGWPKETSHAILVRAPDATHVYIGLDLSRLTGAAKPAVVVTADDLVKAGTRVPEFYAGDLFCPVGRTPLYLGQPVALLLFDTFDAFDQARLALRDQPYVKFGEETGPVVMPDYGAWRFTFVAGPTPEAPDVYSPLKDGWINPPHVQNTECRCGRRRARSPAAPMRRARSTVRRSAPSLPPTIRPSWCSSANSRPSRSTRCSSSRNAGWVGTTAAAKKLELVLGVQSPYEAAEAVAFVLGKASAPFKPTRIACHFAYLGGGFGGTRPHAVPDVRGAGGDVPSRPAGPPRP